MYPYFWTVLARKPRVKRRENFAAFSKFWKRIT
jgi:hypothetical protein